MRWTPDFGPVYKVRKYGVRCGIAKEKGMSRIRRKHGSQTKAKVALEASRNESTLSEIAFRYKIHPIQVSKWRKELLERAHELFTDGRSKSSGTEESSTVKELYEQIGRLKVENDFLKKKSGL